jgi:hypothetical protein
MAGPRNSSSLLSICQLVSRSPLETISLRAGDHPRQGFMFGYISGAPSSILRCVQPIAKTNPPLLSDDAVTGLCRVFRLTRVAPPLGERNGREPRDRRPSVMSRRWTPGRVCAFGLSKGRRPRDRRSSSMSRRSVPSRVCAPGQSGGDAGAAAGHDRAATRGVAISTGALMAWGVVRRSLRSPGLAAR